MTNSRRLLAGALVLAALAASAPAVAEPRTALIVGNAGYAWSPLRNPVNDASDMAASLRGAGFDVILRTEADQRTMRDAVRAFGDALRAKGGVGLFFFSGHGTQINGENYILPIGRPVGSGEELKAQSITAAEVVDAMAGARNGLNIVVLDACRDNPFSGAARGLSRMDSSASLFVSFATSPGAFALDGTGRNSPYTKHLTQAINTANLSLEETFKRTLKGVYQETRGSQTPWLSSSFFGDFVFRQDGAGASGAGAPSAGGAIPKEPREAPLRQPATATAATTAVGPLSLRGQQSGRQPLSRHGGGRGGRRPPSLHLVDRHPGLHRRRTVRRADAGGELGGQPSGGLYVRAARQPRWRMGRRHRHRPPRAVRARRAWTGADARRPLQRQRPQSERQPLFGHGVDCAPGRPLRDGMANRLEQFQWNRHHRGQSAHRRLGQRAADRLRAERGRNLARPVVGRPGRGRAHAGAVRLRPRSWSPWFASATAGRVRARAWAG